MPTVVSTVSPATFNTAFLCCLLSGPRLLPKHWHSRSLLYSVSSPTAYQSSPCHVEVILAEAETVVSRPDDEDGPKKVSKKKMKKERLQNRQ